MPQVAGVDQAHEHIADKGAVLSLIEESIFAIQNGLFQHLFTDIIVQGRTRHAQEKGQGLPVFEHVGDGLPQT